MSCIPNGCNPPERTTAVGQKPTSPFGLLVRFFHELTFAMELSEIAIR
jgi:hypothetical protein